MLIDLASIITAVIAVIIATHTAIYTTKLAGEISKRALISEFRQKWINDQRDDIASFFSLVSRYNFLVSDMHRVDKLKELEQIQQKAYHHIYRITLRINPRDNPYKSSDEDFLNSLDLLIKSIGLNGMGSKYKQRFESALSKSRELLKREWEVTKDSA